jgi:hypothetical protein
VGGTANFNRQQNTPKTPTPLLAACGTKRKYADAIVGQKLGFLPDSARLPDPSGPMRTHMDMKPGSEGGNFRLLKYLTILLIRDQNTPQKYPHKIGAINGTIIAARCS